MVQKFVSIGFIGLLIALSNASKNGEKEKNFEFTMKEVEMEFNFASAFKTTVQNPFKIKKAQSTDTVDQVTCIAKYPIYCTSDQIIQDDIDFAACINLKGFTANTQKKVLLKNASPSLRQGLPEEMFMICQKAQYTTEGDPETQLMIYDVIGESSNLIINVDSVESTEDKKIRCTITTENPQNTQYFSKSYSADALKNNQTKQVLYEKFKTSLNPYRSKKPLELRAGNVTVKYNIQCSCDDFKVEAKWWQSYGLWISLFAVGIGIGGFFYWFFYFGEEINEEGNYIEKEKCSSDSLGYTHSTENII